MTAGIFSAAVLVSVCLSAVLCPGHGFEVSQSQLTLRTDGSAGISCECTGDVGTVEDVRLNSISSDQPKNMKMLCQKAMEYCPNVVMYEETPKKYVFVIFNIGAEAMELMYQCEITVNTNDLDSTKQGTPTKLLAVAGPTEEKPTTVPPSLAPPPMFSWGPSQWILIGLLALLVLLALYACTISFLHNRLKRSKTDPENSTYVEMRKAPPKNNPDFDMYCG